jgi:hypothetical protein
VSQGYEIPLPFAHMGSHNFSITKTMTTLRASGFGQFLLQYQKSHGVFLGKVYEKIVSPKSITKLEALTNCQSLPPADFAENLPLF